VLKLQTPQIPSRVNMRLVIHKCIAALILYPVHQLRMMACLSIGVIQSKECCPEVWQVTYGTPCVVQA
jgi:hypothetical protein